MRVAVLEDDPAILKDLVHRLRESGLVEVVLHARERAEFLAEAIALHPDALVLDIDLVGDPQGGLLVARELALPVLFFSGHVGRNLEAIEVLDSQHASVPVAHLSKTCTDEVFQGRLRKFVEEVRSWQRYRPITLRPSGKGGTMEVEVTEIVAIMVDPRGAASNNKRVLFLERKPVTIADVTLARLGDFGFPEDVFIRISSRCAVNRLAAMEWTGTHVKVRYQGSDGSPVTEVLPITGTFRKRRG